MYIHFCLCWLYKSGFNVKILNNTVISIHGQTNVILCSVFKIFEEKKAFIYLSTNSIHWHMAVFIFLNFWCLITFFFCINKKDVIVAHDFINVVAWILNTLHSVCMEQGYDFLINHLILKTYKFLLIDSKNNLLTLPESVIRHVKTCRAVITCPCCSLSIRVVDEFCQSYCSFHSIWEFI